MSAFLWGRYGVMGLSDARSPSASYLYGFHPVCRDQILRCASFTHSAPAPVHDLQVVSLFFFRFWFNEPTLSYLGLGGQYLEHFTWYTTYTGYLE